MATKQDTASASLEGLRQIGSGWHLSVAAAISRGDHKALGMDRREFAEAAGGFKLMDPRDAIIELHKQGMGITAIAEILGVARDRTVNRILHEEGLVETSNLGTGRDASDTPKEIGRGASDTVDGTAEDLDAELEQLRAEVDRAHAAAAEARMDADRAHERAVGEIRQRTQALDDQLKEARKDRIRLERALAEAQDTSLSEADRNRLEKERQAMLHEIEAKFAPIHASRVVEGLSEATESLRELIELGVDSRTMTKIERAHDAFLEEFTVAMAAVGMEVR